jgi:hypothetical protein
LFASPFVSTQAALQSLRPCAQFPEHTPLLHSAAAPEQAFPQRPQFRGSVAVAAQRPLQSVVPAGQAQSPELHV